VTTLSLKDLKAENAVKDEVKQDVPVEDIKEDVKDEYVEVDESDKAVEKDVDGSEDAPKTENETESWMETEETGNSEDDNKTGFVPNHEAAKRRKQAKALKGEIKDQADENQKLLERIAALESGTQPQAAAPQQRQLSARPTREQHDFDDDAYDAAVDKWNDEKFDLKINSHINQSQQANQQKQAQQTQQDNLKKSLDSHYERADKLVVSGKVTAESYRNADTIVRRSLDSISNGNGEQITNSIISTLNSLGDGSEKVMYQLGVNGAKMSQLQTLLTSDPSGLQAVAYLGQLHSQVQTPNKRRSQAPNPSSNADGETGSTGKAGTLHKKYSKSSDAQERITMKRQAKRDGVDVSNW
tara:strand:- start:881 stop:1948 length:1068 start_codon:yes stop_codon:yes gene_type:complete